MEEQNNVPRNRDYWARLPEFEGPLDILLHFVKEDELDIYNIPISKITKDFLSYLDYVSAMDIDVASEFLLMAAELMKIKARMLIPQPEIEAQEGDEEDPRLTLVRKLLEYKRFKDATERLRLLEEETKRKFNRFFFDLDYKELEHDITKDPGLKNLNIINLIKSYKIAISAAKKVVSHTIETYDVTPETQREEILKLLEEKNEIDFMELLISMEERIYIVCTFLAILQLALDNILEIVVTDMDRAKFKLIKRSTEALQTV